MDSPGLVIQKLAGIDEDLAARQNALERAARAYYALERDLEVQRARTFLNTKGTVEERKSATIDIISRYEEWGKLKDALVEYEGQKAVVKVLTTRASIGQSILRYQGRET